MADMDVTLVRLSNSESVQTEKLNAYPMSLNATNDEIGKLKDEEMAVKGEAMKWKSRFIQIHNLVAAEKHRKLIAMNNSVKIDKELPEDNSSSDDFTNDMARRLQASNEIGSDEFKVMWGGILKNWEEEDGVDAIVRVGSRTGTNRSNRSGKVGVSGGGRRTNKEEHKFTGLLETSESTPALRENGSTRRIKKKNHKSAPNLHQVHEEKKSDEEHDEGTGNEQDQATEANILPMLASISQPGFWEDEHKLTAQIASDRRKAMALKMKQQAIANGDVSIDDIDAMMADMSNPNFDSSDGQNSRSDDASSDVVSVASSLNTVAKFINKARESKRLDIAATGLVKKPLGRLGSSSLLNGGERFDLSGGLRGAKEPPRKRLLESLKRYHDPKLSLKVRDIVSLSLSSRSYRYTHPCILTIPSSTLALSLGRKCKTN